MENQRSQLQAWRDAKSFAKKELIDEDDPEEVESILDGIKELSENFLEETNLFCDHEDDQEFEDGIEDLGSMKSVFEKEMAKGDKTLPYVFTSDVGY